MDSPGSNAMASVTQRSDAFSKFASLKTGGANQYASQILGGTKATLDQPDSTFRGTHVQILESQIGTSLERDDQSSKIFPPVHAQSLH